MVLSWFSNRVNPIAVDIGTSTVKLLQVEPCKDGQARLVAAACEAIPDEVRGSAVERDAFVTESIRKMMLEGFRGRQVVTCLPSGQMAMQHLRMAKMTAEELTKALPFEAAGKLPFDASRAVLRHAIAGEVYQNQEVKQEVILMAAPREVVDRHLGVFSRAKLEVVGIHVEPTALIECFGHLFKRKGDENVSTLFVDMGAGSTHIVIAHGKNLVFAKHLVVGGDAFNRRVAEGLKCEVSAARDIRVRAAHQQAQAVRLPVGLVGIGDSGKQASDHPMGRQNGPAAANGAENGTGNGAALEPETIARVGEAVGEPLQALISDLELCLRYYESIFPGRTVDRAIFVGGESRHVALCQAIAQRIAVPATLGDPLARLQKDSVAKTTVDLRLPQPGWAIAVGLGIGLSPAPAE